MELKGRRVPVPADGSFPVLEQAGDYCGPIVGRTGELPAVFYLLPVARDAGAEGAARSVHHAVSPPHRFIEEPDGTLTILESIGANPHWHGFLIEGTWCKSKRGKYA